MFFIEAILAEVSKAELTGSIVDEAITIRHGTLLIVFEGRSLKAGLDAFSELLCEHVHLFIIA